MYVRIMLCGSAREGAKWNVTNRIKGDSPYRVLLLGGYRFGAEGNASSRYSRLVLLRRTCCFRDAVSPKVSDFKQTADRGHTSPVVPVRFALRLGHAGATAFSA